MIDDADDAGVGGRLGGIERERGLACRARRTRARRRRRRPHRARRACGRPRSPIGRDRLQHEQLVARRGSASFMVATTSPMTRASCIDAASSLTSIGVDDADDGGVDRTVLQAGRHARGAAADDEHGLADAGVDGVDGDEIVAFRLAGRIDRARDEQLGADEPLVLARRDDGADDLGEIMIDARCDCECQTFGIGIRPSSFAAWPCRSAARLRGSRAGAE